MSEPLAEAVDERFALLRHISELGDFQPGSISNSSLVESPAVIAPSPLTLGTALTPNSLRRSMARRLLKTFPRCQRSAKRRARLRSSAGFRR